MRIYFSIHAGDSIAHLTRTVGVAKELQRRGHSISYASSPWTQAHVETHGLPFVSTNQLVGHRDVAKLFIEREVSLLSKMIETERENIRAFNPDLIVADPGLHANLLSETIPKIRILHGLYLHLFSPKGSLKRKREVTCSIIEGILNRVAKKCGLPTIFKYEDLFSDRVIVPGVKKFEISDTIPNVRYIGPIIYPSKKSKGDPSIAYITMGTGNKNFAFLQDILTKTKNKFEKTYVSTGNWPSPAFDLAGHNAVVRSFFKGIPEDAGLVLCHGGHGTVYQALYSNKKIIAIPYNLDQLVQGCNLVRTNTGLSLSGEINDILVTPYLGRLNTAIFDLEDHALSKLSIPKINDIASFANSIEA